MLCVETHVVKKITMIMIDELNEGWKQWIDINLKRGCEKNDLLHSMIVSGVKESVAKQALSISSDIITYPYDKLPSTNLLEKNVIVFGNDETKIYVMNNFLNPAQCHTLQYLSTQKLRPSTTTTNEKYYRTSYTHDFDSSHPVYAEIDNILSKFINIPLHFAEPTQVQRYLVGDKFDEHTDWFNPNHEEWAYTANKGQRTWTITVYLNDVEDGGETEFPKLNIKIKPKMGRLVAWNNLLSTGQGNHDTLHKGCQVTQGQKFIITKWFRDKYQC